MKKKPLLSQKSVQARLDFAKSYENWTVTYWKQVVLSYETKVDCFCSRGSYWRWAQDGEGLTY